MRDLACPRERQLRARCDGCPADDRLTVIGQDTWGYVAVAQHPDVLPACGSHEVSIRFRVDAVAEAPAHRGVRVLGSEHGGDVVEPRSRRGNDLETHQATLTRGPPRSPTLTRWRRASVGRRCE